MLCEDCRKKVGALVADQSPCGKCGEAMDNHHPSLGCPYQGWTNYETWAVNLWMSNDEGSYRYWQGEAKAATDPDDPETLAEVMKEHYEQLLEDQTLQRVIYNTLFADLLSGALSAVNWYEIARSWIDDLEPTK